MDTFDVNWEVLVLKRSYFTTYIYDSWFQCGFWCALTSQICQWKISYSEHKTLTLLPGESSCGASMKFYWTYVCCIENIYMPWDWLPYAFLYAFSILLVSQMFFHIYRICYLFPLNGAFYVRHNSSCYPLWLHIENMQRAWSRQYVFVCAHYSGRHYSWMIDHIHRKKNFCHCEWH